MSNEQKKARELVDKYLDILEPVCDGYLDNAKSCAIICCDQIIFSLFQVTGSENYLWNEREREAHGFWYNVKMEIEKM